MALLLLLPGGLAAILVVLAAVWRVHRGDQRSLLVSLGPGARAGGAGAGPARATEDAGAGTRRQPPPPLPADGTWDA